MRLSLRRQALHKRFRLANWGSILTRNIRASSHIEPGIHQAGETISIQQQAYRPFTRINSSNGQLLTLSTIISSNLFPSSVLRALPAMADAAAREEDLSSDAAGGASQTFKDLFAGAAGGVAQVLIGELWGFLWHLRIGLISGLVRYCFRVVVKGAVEQAGGTRVAVECEKVG